MTTGVWTRPPVEPYKPIYSELNGVGLMLGGLGALTISGFFKVTEVFMGSQPAIPGLIRESESDFFSDIAVTMLINGSLQALPGIAGATALYIIGVNTLIDSKNTEFINPIL